MPILLCQLISPKDLVLVLQCGAQVHFTRLELTIVDGILLSPQSRLDRIDQVGMLQARGAVGSKVWVPVWERLAKAKITFSLSRLKSRETHRGSNDATVMAAPAAVLTREAVLATTPVLKGQSVTVPLQPNCSAAP